MKKRATIIIALLAVVIAAAAFAFRAWEQANLRRAKLINSNAAVMQHQLGDVQRVWQNPEYNLQRARQLLVPGASQEDAQRGYAHLGAVRLTSPQYEEATKLRERYER